MARKLIVEVIGDSSSLERSLGRASRATNTFGTNFSRTERGVLAGSGVFRSLGRSVAFASTAFVGVASATAVLRDSIEQAETGAKAHAALAAALSKVGESSRRQLPAVNAWAQQQAKFGVSANTAVTGLARLVELTGSSAKAMAGYTAALEISKATGKDFNAVSLAVGKALSGQTTALARYIGKIPKGTSATELLAKVQAKFGGQAEANTVATDRLRAEVTNLETAIGAALLPTVESLATRLSDWLGKSQNQARVQRDVTNAVDDTAAALNEIRHVIDDVDKVTGSFKNTLEFLVALKVAAWATEGIGGLAGLALGMRRTETAAVGAEAATKELTTGQAILAAQAGVTAFALTTLGLKATGLDQRLRNAGGGLQSFVAKIPQVSGVLNAVGLNPTATSTASAAGDKPGQIGGVNVKSVELFVHQLEDAGRSSTQVLTALEKRFVSLTSDDLQVLLRIAEKTRDAYTSAGGAAEEAAAKAAHGIAAAQALASVSAPAATGSTATRGLQLTAAQKNTFFDNAIARILLRGGLGDISQQIGALEKADNLIQQRLNVTKDVTRRLNLEDELLQNAAQISSLKSQQAADALQKAQDARQKALDALAARATARNASQFKTLGFTGTGSDVIPGVSRLKSELGTIEDALKGTVLDTPKLQQRLEEVRKVLSGKLGAVGADVRSKIQDILASVSKQLDASQNATKFAHANSNAVLAGLGLTAAQTRALRERISQIGAGGTVPREKSQAFGLAGGNNQTIVLQVDGRTLAKVVTPHQQKTAKARTSSRRG